MDEKLIEALRPFAKMVAEEIVKMGQMQDKAERPPERKLRGIPGIMEIAQCSRSKAVELKASGVLDDAITHVSPRVFLVDEAKAYAALEKIRKDEAKAYAALEKIRKRKRR